MNLFFNFFKSLVYKVKL